MRAEDVDERADDDGAEEVEDEAGVGLKAEDAGGDAEEGGGEVADVADYLFDIVRLSLFSGGRRGR